jgi:cytidylate kinase
MDSENAIVPHRESNSSGLEPVSESKWFGWLKNLIPGQNRSKSADESPQQARFTTVWISREAGSGADIVARQVAARLSWRVYNEEFVDIIARRMQVTPDMIKSLDELAPGMIQDWILPLREQHYAPQETYMDHLEHLIREVGHVGEAVMVGRGAGFLLPEDRTLRVRIVAPETNRAARLADRMGVSHRTARRMTRDLDRRRNQFDWSIYRKDAANPHNYHITLDTAALGIPLCVDVITLAVIRGFPPGWFSAQRVVKGEAQESSQDNNLQVMPETGKSTDLP